MKLSDSRIKKFLIFPEMDPCTFRPQPQDFFLKKVVYIFLKKHTLKKFLILSQKKLF